MKGKGPSRGLAWAAAVLAAACARDEAPMPEGVVATVDGSPVTVEDLERRLERRGSRMQASAAAEGREALLEELIHFEILAANARKAGYEQNAEVQAALEQLMVRRFQEDQLEASLESLAVSDQDVEAYYNDHIADYTVAEAVRVGVIFVQVPPRAGEEKRQALAARAAEVREEIAASAEPAQAFARAATHSSDDQTTRYRRGDAGWLSRDDTGARWEPAVVEAAFALSEPGALAPVVEGSRGFYVMRLVERRPSRARALAQVGDAIRYQLLRERREGLERDFHAQMRRNVTVEINQELLESLPLAERQAVGAGPRRPPRLPSG